MSEPEKIDWIENLREGLGLNRPLAIGGPPPPVPCSVCGETVDLSEEERYSRSSRRTCRPCIRAREAEQRRVALGRTIPPRYRDAVLGGVEIPVRVKAGAPSAERVEAVLRAERVVFVGHGQSGKTTLAVAMLREAARRGADAMFVTALDLSTASAKHKLGSGSPPLIDDASEVPLLLIDDVGNERHTELSDLRAVVWKRHDYERPIWITTGLNRAQIASTYGAGFVGRLLQDAAIVQCDPRVAGGPP